MTTPSPLPSRPSGDDRRGDIPQGSFILPSVEVRWFLDGEPPDDLSRWMEARADTGTSGRRTDVYVVLDGAPHTGIKLREGRVEVKVRRGEAGSGEGVPGAVEWWTKWSQPAPLGLEDMAGSGEVPLARVTKDRKAFFAEGVLTEVTRLELGNGRPAGWTVGLEAVAMGEGETEVPREVRKAALAVLTLPGMAALLTPARSMGYPAWLLQQPRS